MADQPPFEKPTMSATSTATQTTSANFTVRTLYRTKLVPGRAYEFTVYAKWAYDNTGAISIWQDRRLAYSETGAANCSNHDPARGAIRARALREAVSVPRNE